LLDRVGAPATDVGPSTTRLGDWYANLISPAVSSSSSVSERGRLPVVLRAREVKRLAALLAAAVGDVLKALAQTV
jgi:hypothetical protein